MTVSDWYCSNNTTVTSENRAGPTTRGACRRRCSGSSTTACEYNGSVQGSLWRPATDTDFLILTYWAADLVAASTYKDRYEVANRIMEILDKHSNWPTAAKRHYCDIFEHHGFDNYIEPSYCN